MKDALYQRIRTVDKRLAEKYLYLPDRLKDRLKPGLEHSIRSTDRIDMAPSVEAIREIIEDGLRGYFHFEEHLNDRRDYE
jgi:hypothetical protein